MWPLPDTLFMPTRGDYSSVFRPFWYSYSMKYYSKLWEHDVLCHPDAWRNPIPVMLWLGLLWIGVLLGGLWLFWQKGEMTGKDANFTRLGVFMVVPFAAWASFGLPVIMGVVCTVFAFFFELVRASRDHGASRHWRMILGLARVQASNEWKEVAWLVCGDVKSLPVYDSHRATQDPPSDEEVKTPPKTDGSGEDKPRHISCDAEKTGSGRDRDVDVLDTDVVAGNEARPTPMMLRGLQTLYITLLSYFSGATLLLCERRSSIRANAIVDDILWNLALTGLAISAQAAIIVISQPSRPSTSIDQHPSAVPNAVETDPPNEKSPSQRALKSQNRTPLILQIRFGGSRSTPSPTASSSSSSSSPDSRPGTLGAIDGITRVLILQNLLYPRAYLPHQHPSIDAFIRTATLAFIPAAAPYLWSAAVIAIALPLTLLHQLLARVLRLPDARATKALEALLPKTEHLVSTLKAQYARLPPRWRWAYETFYYPAWIVGAYAALYVIVARDVVSLDARVHARENIYPCLDLWTDPWAKKLLGPLFWPETNWLVRGASAVVEGGGGGGVSTPPALDRSVGVLRWLEHVVDTL